MGGLLSALLKWGFKAGQELGRRSTDWGWLAKNLGQYKWVDPNRVKAIVQNVRNRDELEAVMRWIERNGLHKSNLDFLDIWKGLKKTIKKFDDKNLSYDNIKDVTDWFI